MPPVYQVSIVWSTRDCNNRYDLFQVMLTMSKHGAKGKEKVDDEDVPIIIPVRHPMVGFN